jgi:hypothetical protein
MFCNYCAAPNPDVAENKFWRIATMPYFLVTLAPFDDRSGDNDGSGFTNAYMLFLS